MLKKIQPEVASVVVEFSSGGMTEKVYTKFFVWDAETVTRQTNARFVRSECQRTQSLVIGLPRPPG